ncbi:MAG: hypothetical protein ACFFDK_09560 [Promethearchaeota archaeon]
MGIEQLSELEILHGIFTTIFVVISLLVGLKILLKYFEHKRTELVAVGIAWMGMSTPWIGNSSSFLLYVLFGYRLEIFPYLFMENAFIPLALICWIYAFSTLVYPRSVKKITVTYAIICLTYETFLIAALIVDPKIIGSLEGMFDSNHTLIPNLFRVFGIFTVLITGVIFAKKSLISDEPSIQWKGRFMLIAMISFTVGAFLDAVLTFTPLQLVLVRLLLISSSIEYYLGFFLPDFVANRLIKKE